MSSVRRACLWVDESERRESESWHNDDTIGALENRPSMRCYSLRALCTAGWVVSSSFRGVAPIMFRIIADDNQVKDHQATHVVGKGPDFVRFGAKLTEEA